MITSIQDVLLDGRYRVLNRLGEGGMGKTYLVEDERLSRRCVAKVCSYEEPEYLKQFEQEARLLAELNHPNLPQVYDYFGYEGQYYLVMQYIQGQSLDRLQSNRSAPFEVERALRWASGLLNALVYLHGQHPPIIHRDIKPANICITPDDKAVLLDFGIARRLDEPGTRTVAQAFSAHYAPIEQYRGMPHSYPTLRLYLDELDQAGIHTGTYSDVYALGATLYFALTLLEPPDVCMRYFGEKIPPIRQYNADAPDYIIEALDRALTIDPRERCQTAQEFRDLLESPATVDRKVSQTREAREQVRPIDDVSARSHELVYIAQGEFLMGSDHPRIGESARPPHRIRLGAYGIARYPVTHADYQEFIAANPEHPVPYSPMRFAQRYNWDRRTRTFPAELADHPVVLVTWHDAVAYCRWLSETSGGRCRLPTEAEWEKAACWNAAAGRARLYPWGDAFDEERCNVDAHGALRLSTTPIGHHSPGGDSPYGLADMAGNVWEWTASLYRPYPYNAQDGREDAQGGGDRVVRGGAYDDDPRAALSAWRKGTEPDHRLANIGFRVACKAR